MNLLLVLVIGLNAFITQGGSEDANATSNANPPGVFMGGVTTDYEDFEEPDDEFDEDCPERKDCECPDFHKICVQRYHKKCKVTTDCDCPHICCEALGHVKVCIACRKPKQTEEMLRLTKVKLFSAPGDSKEKKKGKKEKKKRKKAKQKE